MPAFLVRTPVATTARACARWGEMLGWSLVVRLLVARASLSTTLQVLDRLPRRAAAPTAPVPWPSDPMVRLAGACLGRSLARSQYLRRRGVPHSIVIGTTGSIAGFRAHAWVSPYESTGDDFVELWRIER